MQIFSFGISLLKLRPEVGAEDDDDEEEEGLLLMSDELIELFLPATKSCLPQGKSGHENSDIRSTTRLDGVV